MPTMTSFRELNRFFREHTHKYVRYLRRLSWKNLLNATTRFHAQNINVKRLREVTAETGKSLSDSMLFKMQKEYYQKQGVNAWANQIPFEPTSNPFIAHSYAQVAVAFIKDCIAKSPAAMNSPFYFLELGAGCGRFSFYVVKAILELLQLSGLEQVNVKYVMSDFADHNFKYYQTHHALKPYIEAGIIDFALFDIAYTLPVKLHLSNIELTQETLVNPLVVFANYVFDSVANDLFFACDNTLQKLAVVLRTMEDNMAESVIKKLKDAQISFQPCGSADYRYHVPAIDDILEYYRTNLQDIRFLLPIAVFKTMMYLNRLSNDRVLWLTTDKGNCSLQSIKDNVKKQILVFHGDSCFSLNVNFHALALFFKNSNGDARLSPQRGGNVDTAVYVSGFTFAELPETNRAVAQYVEQASPGDYVNIAESFYKDFSTYDFYQLATFLAFSHWNPTVYCVVSERLNQLLPAMKKSDVEFFTNCMAKIAGNYYYLPETRSVLHNIALLFWELKDYDQAIVYYTQASHFDIDLFIIHYNLGLCFYHKNNISQALTHFKKAIEFAVDKEEADYTREWIEDLSAKLVSG
jgi:tetratricopeptide (TPR) repeat protein